MQEKDIFGAYLSVRAGKGQENRSGFPNRFKEPEGKSAPARFLLEPQKRHFYFRRSRKERPLSLVLPRI